MKEKINFVKLLPDGILSDRVVLERLAKIPIYEPLDYETNEKLIRRPITKEIIDETYNLFRI